VPELVLLRGVKQSLIPFLAVLVLSACDRGDSGQSLVERLGASATPAPDEFMVMPRKPLILPDDLSLLPQPRPGLGNRADLTPVADAQIALGGGAGLAPARTSDAPLLAAILPAEANIRDILREEDREWRRRNRASLLARLFRVNTEATVYRRMILDQAEETRRLRALGVTTASAPVE